MVSHRLHPELVNALRWYAEAQYLSLTRTLPNGISSSSQYYCIFGYHPRKRIQRCLVTQAFQSASIGIGAIMRVRSLTSHTMYRFRTCMGARSLSKYGTKIISVTGQCLLDLRQEMKLTSQNADRTRKANQKSETTNISCGRVLYSTSQRHVCVQFVLFVIFNCIYYRFFIIFTCIYTIATLVRGNCEASIWGGTGEEGQSCRVLWEGINDT